MGRENELYREQLAVIREAFPDKDCLGIGDVCAFTGLSAKVVDRLFPGGWIGERRGRYITRAALAREMTRARR